MQLWRSGLVWFALSFVGAIGNFLFSGIIGRRLLHGEYGYTNSALDYMGLLALPLQMVTTSLAHYIAYFRGKNDDARLQGLLAGCQNFLLKATVAGSILAIVLSEPLGRFFHFPRSSLMLATLMCVLVGMWSGFAIALCQGMAWFKRMAAIGVGVVAMRLLFGWVMTKKFPIAEVAVSATTFSLLANLSLLYWWKDIFRHDAERIRPWTREFRDFLLVTGATVGGTYFFSTADGLVATKYFPHQALDAYQAAARFGRAIPLVLGSLLLTMFISRSGSKEGAAKTDQRILLGLYAAALACGGLGLILFRGLLVKLILGRDNADAAAMMIPFAITMVLIGLNQAIGMWSLAGRGFKMAILYGALGLVYWLTLLLAGKTPSALLLAMPIGAGAGFCVLCACWLGGLSRKTSD